MIKNVEEQRPYRHFKGELYYVHHIVTHTETGEIFVSYQALYPPYNMYIRPIEMFLEEIDIHREDNVTKQKFRFQLYTGE